MFYSLPEQIISTLEVQIKKLDFSTRWSHLSITQLENAKEYHCNALAATYQTFRCMVERFFNGTEDATKVSYRLHAEAPPFVSVLELKGANLAELEVMLETYPERPAMSEVKNSEEVSLVTTSNLLLNIDQLTQEITAKAPKLSSEDLCIWQDNIKDFCTLFGQFHKEGASRFYEGPYGDRVHSPYHVWVNLDTNMPSDTSISCNHKYWCMVIIV